EASFKLIRDLIVFTDKRLILVDKQGITGKKIEFHSILYNSITHYTVETAGTFDLDSELKIWVGGATDPLIHKLFRKDSSIFDIQKILAVMTLSSINVIYANSITKLECKRLIFSIIRVYDITQLIKITLILNFPFSN